MEAQEHQKNREFLAAVYRDLSEARRRLQADPQFLHYRSSVGETPFHYLIVESNLERAAKLFEWGADINTQDDFGATPLMNAVTLGALDVVKWLVEHGASLEPKNASDETALALATSNEKATIFQFLISIPRKHPIDYYYDDITAHVILGNEELVMREYLAGLGLTGRFDS
jgi:ankyrin repeat protein